MFFAKIGRKDEKTLDIWQRDTTIPCALFCCVIAASVDSTILVGQMLWKTCSIYAFWFSL